MERSMDSVSRLPFELEISGKGSARCELIRYLAPLTCSTILKNLPFQNRAHRLFDKFVYTESGLTIGAEKQRGNFKRGDITFFPSNGSLCICLKNTEGYKMNPIGRVLDSLEPLDAVQSGDTVFVRRI